MIRNQRGYTLIELLLYIVVISGLLLGLTAFYGSLNDARIKSQSIAEVDQQADFIMDKMTQTVRNATSITTPAAAATSTSLVLVVPTSTLSPTTFALASGIITMKEGSGAAVALNSDDVTASNLSIDNNTRSGTNGIAQISFTLSRVNNTGRSEYDYSKTYTQSAAVRW